MVGILGLEGERPWGSFFLQYLWEFGLGMWIAERCMNMNDGRGKMLMYISTYKWWWLLLGVIGGNGLSAMMTWNGGVLKLYNDIPSLIGYLSVALLIYKIGLKAVNRFFEWTNSFSYELYLVHSLVYVVMSYLLAVILPIPVLLTAEFIAAYLCAYGFKALLQKSNQLK